MRTAPYDDLPSVTLALRPTPLQRMERLSAELGIDLWFKRDDLTGASLSGNKVRKLELLLGDAVAAGADTVLTCGGIQSNHARATAIAAAQLGLQSVLILRGTPPDRLEGNLLLDRLVGARIRWVTPEQYRERDAVFAEEVAKLRADGRRPYVIPEGGSNALGALGYARAWDELETQAAVTGVRFDSVVCAVGSGGTLAGLLAGARLRNFTGRVVGVNVCDDAPTFERIVGDLLDELGDRWGIPATGPAVELLDGFVGRGYALSTPEELALLRHVATLEGQILDPVYTGKALFGLVSTLRQSRAAFGERVAFLHSGGIFGLFPKAGAPDDVLQPD